MARVKNQVRIVDAKLKNQTLNTYGPHFPVDYNCDGFAIVTVDVPSVPADVKQYLEGDSNVVVYTIPSNVTKLCNYALSSFPNISSLFIFKFDSMMQIDAHALDGLNNLQSIFVPENFIQDYKDAYPAYEDKFKSLVVDHVLTIPYQQNPTLTVDFVRQVIDSLELGTKVSCTKCIIDEGYETAEFGALEPIFDGELPNAEIQLDNGVLFLSNAYGVTVSGAIMEVE